MKRSDNEDINRAVREREMEIVRILTNERAYWLEANFENDAGEWEKASIIASGALSNVVAAIAMGTEPAEFAKQVRRRK